MRSLFHGKAVLLSGLTLCALTANAFADPGLIPSSEETAPTGSSVQRLTEASQQNNALIENRQDVTALSGQVSALAVMTDSRGHLPGDVDLDGDVDLEDYRILVANIHTDNDLHQEADVNDDGKIDFYDFRLLKTNFGKSLDPNQLPLEKIAAISGASGLIYATFTGVAVIGDYLLGVNSLDGGAPAEGSVMMINANPLSPDYLKRNTDIYFPNPTTFQQTGTMFGYDITGFGNNFFISAPSEDLSFSQQNRGAVYLFNPFSRQPIHKFISPLSDAGSFGESIALKGNLLFVGEKYAGHNGQNSAGAVHVFNADINSPDFGSLIRTIYNNTAGANTQFYFGESIAIVGNYLVSTTIDYSQGSNGNATIKLVNLSNPSIVIDVPNVPLSDDTLGYNSRLLQMTGIGKDLLISYPVSDSFGGNNGVALLIDTTPGSATFGQILTTFQPPLNAAAGMGFGASVAVMGTKAVISGAKGDTFIFEADRSSANFGDLVQTIFLDPRRPNYAFYYNQLAVKGDRLYITAPNAAEFNDKASNVHVFKATPHFGSVTSERSDARSGVKVISGVSKSVNSEENINSLRLDSLRKKQRDEEFLVRKTSRAVRR